MTLTETSKRNITVEQLRELDRQIAVMDGFSEALALHD
jgi:hypothetical protein